MEDTLNRNHSHIILFNPRPYRGWYTYRRRAIPLGLIYTAAPLEHLGYQVTIIDQHVEPSWKKNLFAALTKKPVCFGVTCMTGPQISSALGVCRLVKDKHPDLPIVWEVFTRPSYRIKL